MAVEGFQQRTCSTLEIAVKIIRRLLSDTIYSLHVSSVAPRKRPRVAIIGTGITGIGAACQCLDSGFDISIFEANSKTDLGGIWAVSQAHKKALITATKIRP